MKQIIHHIQSSIFFIHHAGSFKNTSRNRYFYLFTKPIAHFLHSQCSLWPFTFRSQQSDYIVLGWFHSFIDHQRKLYTNCLEKKLHPFQYRTFGQVLVQSFYIGISTRSFRVPSRSPKGRLVENSKIFFYYIVFFLYVQTLGQIFK